MSANPTGFSRSAFRVATSLAILVAAFASSPVRAQNPDELLPAESAVKAKGILEQAIDGLGGPAYLNVKNSDCEARLAQFDSSGAAAGSLEITLVKEPPDKTRMELHGDNYITNIFYYEVHGKSTVVNIYAGDQGWLLDKGGVEDLSANARADYQEQLKSDLHTILRQRMNDPSLTLRYGGTDIVDLKQVDWVEASDHAQLNVRIAIDRKTHLPVRTVAAVQDSRASARIPLESRYSNYQLLDGVQTAMQVVHYRKDVQSDQLFVRGCHYNENLPPDYFTRASLEAAAAQMRKSKKK